MTLPCTVTVGETLYNSLFDDSGNPIPLDTIEKKALVFRQAIERLKKLVNFDPLLPVDLLSEDEINQLIKDHFTKEGEQQDQITREMLKIQLRQRREDNYFQIFRSLPTVANNTVLRNIPLDEMSIAPDKHAEFTKLYVESRKQATPLELTVTLDDYLRYYRSTETDPLWEVIRQIKGHTFTKTAKTLVMPLRHPDLDPHPDLNRAENLASFRSVKVFPITHLEFCLRESDSGEKYLIFFATADMPEENDKADLFTNLNALHLLAYLVATYAEVDFLAINTCVRDLLKPDGLRNTLWITAPCHQAQTDLFDIDVDAFMEQVEVLLGDTVVSSESEESTPQA